MQGLKSSWFWGCLAAMADAFQFLVATVIWSLVGATVLKTGLVHPIALFAVWLIGFVWMAGYIGSGVPGCGSSDKGMALDDGCHRRSRHRDSSNP